MSDSPTIGVVVVTLNAANHLRQCLGPVFRSSLKPRVLVADSSSEDGTVELAKQMGADVLHVRDFNHGATRELARKHIGTDVVVMMTQDAYPEDETFLDRLVAPLAGGRAAVSYARQIPRRGAGPVEAFPRAFNYPPVSEIRSIDDVSAKGSFTFFCSNACAAWVNRSLDEIGGFSPVLTHEDTFAVAKLLSCGHRVAYVADAVVRHSHRYSFEDEFRRHFDAGWERARHRQLFGNLRDEGRGAEFAREFLKHIATRKPWLLPHACTNLVAKYSGYRCGEMALLWSPSICLRLSGQPYFWTSPHRRSVPDTGAARTAER